MFRALWNLIKLVVFGFIALICIALFLPSNSDKQDNQKANSTESAQVEERVVEAPVVEEPVVEEPEAQVTVEETAQEEIPVENETTEESTESSDTDLGPELTYMAASLMIRSQLEQFIGSGNYEVKYDDKSVTANVWSEGVASGVALLRSGLGDSSLKQSWDSIRSSAIISSDAWADAIIENGLENPVVMYNVVNDQNRDNVLLSAVNGIIIYDATKD